MDTAENILLRWLYENDITFPLDQDGDEQDTENLEVIVVSKKGIDFICGGDWQSPMWLRLCPDGRIEVISENMRMGQPDVFDLDQILSKIDIA